MPFRRGFPLRSSPMTCARRKRSCRREAPIAELSTSISALPVRKLAVHLAARKRLAAGENPDPMLGRPICVARPTRSTTAGRFRSPRASSSTWCKSYLDRMPPARRPAKVQASVTSAGSFDHMRQLASHRGNIERLAQYPLALELRINRVPVVTGREDERDVAGAQEPRQRKNHFTLQVDVHNRGIDREVAVHDFSCVSEVAERADDPSAESVQRACDIIGEKVFVLDHKNAAPREGARRGRARGRVRGHLLCPDGDRPFLLGTYVRGRP